MIRLRADTRDRNDINLTSYLKGYLPTDHPDQIQGEAKDFLRSVLASLKFQNGLGLRVLKEPDWIFNGQEGGAFDWECFYFCSYRELVLFCQTSPHIPN